MRSLIYIVKFLFPRVRKTRRTEKRYIGEMLCLGKTASHSIIIDTPVAIRVQEYGVIMCDTHLVCL